MARSSSSERARRINSAVALIKQHGSVAKSAAALASQYGISRRQAYRYVHEAKAIGKEVQVPEQKIAFTVKLSQSLIQAIRQSAKSTGQSLSEIVTQALEAFLSKGRGRG
jgi:predicted DNA-binding transcriptional regulator YafY